MDEQAPLSKCFFSSSFVAFVDIPFPRLGLAQPYYHRSVCSEEIGPLQKSQELPGKCDNNQVREGDLGKSRAMEGGWQMPVATSHRFKMA